MKKAFIIHGWGADPESDWFPWLKKELESRGFEVSVPEMPDTESPKIEEWVGHLSALLPEPSGDTLLIGHSIGCQTILRYIEKLENPRFLKIILVAPWFTLKGLEDDEWAVAQPWLDTPIDLGKIRSSVKRIVALFSDNDPVVPLDNAKLFEERLGAEVHVYEERGHFNGADGAIELPEILDLIKQAD